MRKKILYTFLMLICCISAFSAAAAAADTPKLYSRSACVIDADNGEILYQKRANRQQRPASITKQMTALLVLEKVKAGEISFDDKVKVTNKALSTVDLQSTRIGFEAGEKRRVSDLMSCMLVYSANDAANILAEYVGGDVDTFVDMMNKKAEELGCTNTHFSNPNGLDPDDDSIHLTTAHDMALISYELTKYPDYYRFAGQARYKMDKDKVVDGWTVGTKVDMLNPNSKWYSKEVKAGKTGWTSKAHHTMCVYTSRGGRNFVIVVMNSLDWTAKYKDTKALMNYCCNNFDTVKLTAADYQTAAEISMQKAGAKQALDTKNLPELKIYLPTGITAADLRYKVTALKGDNARLAVGIASGKWEDYYAATHINGEKAILAVYDLPLKQSLKDKVESSMNGNDTGSAADKGSAASIQLPDDKIIITIAAALLVLISLILLIVRTVNRKKKKKKKPLTIIINTPDMYKDKVENPDNHKNKHKNKRKK